ncbi:hypothetical protein B0T18DRAFT_91891 [Schizothecium vesticola]|uniref:Uncharacterized protein n=1 Tax=Schizothecium vesticola TaxID=314040 RepID=A0AA40KB16_9PEZI|nr:hypothetical protein B0T18DRAFT_91891 [Schizothecium vesticola]
MTDNSSIGTRDDGATGAPSTTDQHSAPPGRERPSSKRRQQNRILQPPRRATRRPSARLLANVETLVRKLSRQNLQQLDEANQELEKSSSASSSRSPPQLTSPSDSKPAPDPEGTYSPERPLATPVAELTALPGSDDPLNPGCPIEIDQDELLPSPSALRSLEEGGDPMDMQYDPPPRLDLVPENIEPGAIPAVTRVMVCALEVDPAYTPGGSDPALDDSADLLEHFRAMRRTMIPGGAVRRTVSGVPLRYRLSTDVALSCQNVVRSRPRMRKRPNDNWQKRSRAESLVSSSSVAPSAVSSPAVQPSHPPCPLPSMPPFL